MEIKVLGAESPVWTNEHKTAITLLVTFSHMPDEAVEFTATPIDDQAYGKALFGKAKAGVYGEVAPFTGKTDAEIYADSFPRRKQLAQAKVDTLIAPLERAARLSMASQEELEQLNKLEVYSIVLMRSTGPDVPAME